MSKQFTVNTEEIAAILFFKLAQKGEHIPVKTAEIAADIIFDFLLERDAIEEIK